MVWHMVKDVLVLLQYMYVVLGVLGVQVRINIVRYWLFGS